MGCNSSKSFDLTVEYQGSKRQITGSLPDYSSLKTWIFDQFPSLRCQGISLKANSIPLNSQSELSYIAKHSDSISITIEEIKTTVDTSLGIVKLRKLSGELLGTGFLINKLYALLPKISFYKCSRNELKIILPDGTEAEMDLEKDPLEISNFFIAVLLNREILEFQPISLNSNLRKSEEIVATVFYYSAKLPVLQKYTGKFEFIDDYKVKNSLCLDSGAIGSPIITIDNKLLGVYIDKSSAVSFKFLSDNFKLPAEGPSVNFFNTNSSSPDIFMDYFSLTACFLDSFNKKLVYYCTTETIKKSITSIDLVNGSSALSTPYGIFICGCNYSSAPQAWIFDGNSLKRLTDPNRSHLFHCSAILNDDIYIISGNTTAIEAFNFTSNSWTVVSSLTKKRNNASAVSYNSNIFVFGGRRDEKILKSIIVFKNHLWSKLPIFFPLGLHALGILLQDKHFIVFGGESTNGKNKQSWKVDLDENIIKEDNFYVTYNFGRFCPFYDTNEVLMFTNDGVLLRFDKAKKNFLTMCVDEEEVAVQRE